MTALEGEIVPPLPRADLALRPPGELATRSDLDAFTDGWLANRRLAANTRAAYRRDVGSWLDWCRDRGVDPMHATFINVNTYARHLEEDAGLAVASVARKLSGLSSWYTFLLRVGGVTVNPVSGTDRPQVARDHSATIGLTGPEVDQLLAAADSDRGPAAARTRAVVAVLADLGIRVGELVGLDVEDLGHERGHRAIRFTGKGGNPRRRALTPASSTAVDAYLADRTDHAGGVAPTGALFVTGTGERIDRHAVFRLIRRLAHKAGIPAWADLSPHSLRHAFATAAREEGVPLEDVQDAMGHADPRTTRRYDRDRHNLDRDPSYVIWSARARRRGAGDVEAS